jgi:hypothetical protein
MKMVMSIGNITVISVWAILLPSVSKISDVLDLRFAGLRRSALGAKNLVFFLDGGKSRPTSPTFDGTALSTETGFMGRRPSTAFVNARFALFHSLFYQSGRQFLRRFHENVINLLAQFLILDRDLGRFGPPNRFIVIFDRVGHLLGQL